MFAVALAAYYVTDFPLASDDCRLPYDVLRVAVNWKARQFRQI